MPGRSLQHLGSQLFTAACGVFSCSSPTVLVAACGVYFPEQGSNLSSLRWEHKVLATGPPGSLFFLNPSPDFSPTVLVCWGYNDKGLQTEWLRQQKCISSQCRRPEVQDKGIGRVSFFWGVSPWLVDDCLLPVSSPGLSSMCLWLNLLSI